MTDAPLLSARLRAETKALHVQAERAGLMGQLLRGQSTLPAYAALLAALSEIYVALEDGLASHAQHPVLGPLQRPEFARASALAMDLRSLAAHGIASLPAVDEATRYAAHLRELTRNDPPRLLAHAWLRYLGDLNGGQIVAGIVRNSLALDVATTQFYEFPALTDPNAAAAEWRRALDAAPLDAETQARIVAEACEGFRRHIALFEALAPSRTPSAQDAADSSSSA